MPVVDRIYVLWPCKMHELQDRATHGYWLLNVDGGVLILVGWGEGAYVLSTGNRCLRCLLSIGYDGCYTRPICTCNKYENYSCAKNIQYNTLSISLISGTQNKNARRPKSMQKLSPTQACTTLLMINTKALQCLCLCTVWEHSSCVP